jgi:hypothetical protein
MARGRPIALAPPDGGDWGPAMAKLNPRHRAVVLSLFDAKGNRTEALRRNGYGKTSSDRNLHAEASKFFARADVRKAVRETCDSYVDGSEPEVIAAVLDILRNEKIKPSDRLRAAGMLWDRSNPVTLRHEVAIEHSFEARHDRAVEDLRILRDDIGASREKLIEIFGYSGLPHYERLLAEREGKLIEASAGEASDDVRP